MDGAFLDPLALNYLDIVRTVRKIWVTHPNNNHRRQPGHVPATPNGQTNLIELNLLLRGRKLGFNFLIKMIDLTIYATI
jgi:hypothetical protein